MELNVSIFIGGVFKGRKNVETPCLIGRSKDAGLTVAHPAMSRRHCELYEESGKLYLRDNSSLNGTLYRGEYVENPVSLNIGDEFTVGELTFRISAPEEMSQEKRREIADRPTASIAVDDAKSEEAKEKPGMATVVEPKSSPPAPDPAPQGDLSPKEPPPQKAKASRKISPKDVRIDLK